MVKIERAEHLDGYLIMFWFDNGEKGTVSFRKSQESTYPPVFGYREICGFSDNTFFLALGKLLVYKFGHSLQIPATNVKSAAVFGGTKRR